MEWQTALDKMADELQQVQQQLSDPEVIANHNLFRELSQRYAQIAPVIEKYHEYQRLVADAAEARQMMEDAEDEEMRGFLHSEYEAAQTAAEKLQQQLLLELVPEDPRDRKNAIVEIRAGTGGDEAALFVGDLFDMYRRFAEHQGWQTDVIQQNPAEMGGFKEIIFGVKGPGAYGILRYESGVHRVQRVPETESQGRIHTSAATVAVLPEVEEIDVEIDPSDLRIEVFH